MKNRLTMASALVATFAFGVGVVVPYAVGNTHASAETDYGECYYVNNNQVSMTKSEYDLLHNIGFDDYEVENMTESKFNKLIGMGFVTTLKEVNIIYESNDENSINDNLYDTDGYDLQSHITGDTPRREFTTSDRTKTMSTYISFAKIDLGYRLFVKQNVNWRVAPDERKTDVIAMSYTPSLVLAEGDYGGIDAEMHLRYRHYEDNHYTIDERSVYGINNKNCRRKSGDYIAYLVDFDGLYDGTPNWLSIYENFFVTMEVTFETSDYTTIRTELQTYYAHQQNKVPVWDWALNVSPEPPFISFSISANTDNSPEFETALTTFASITFDDAWLSRC